jgi:hypothetical protein
MMAERTMTANEPVAELDAPYSSDGAMPVPWNVASSELDKAEVYWLSTVRPDGRPHVTPIAGVWMDGRVHFATGPEERKADNLAHNPHVAVTTGCNTFRSGLDVIVEGDAIAVRDDAVLKRLADAFATKYDEHFGFTARDGRFVHEQGGTADVYEIAPTKAFAYGRGSTFTATRFRF